MNIYSWLHTVVHAVVDAILNKNTLSLKGSHLYTTAFPCNMCAHLIIQSYISKVFIKKDNKSQESSDKAHEAAKQLLKDKLFQVLSWL